MRPFRFGVIAENAQNVKQLLDTARRAEDAGFSSLLLRDHFVEGPFPHQLAPLTALAAVAGATTTLRVGTLVISNDFRHPAVLAKEVATLDQVSGGRFELGLGAGFLGRDYVGTGLRFDPPGERVSRLEEAIAVMKALFGPGPVSHHGRHYTIEGRDSFPKPVQRPHPPIQVAAARPRMLSIAARHADIVGLQTVSTAGGVMTDDPAGRSAGTVAEQVALVRQAACDRFGSLELSTTAAVVITNHSNAAAEDLARQRGWSSTTAEKVFDMPSVFIGSVQQVVDLFNERRETHRISYFVVSDRALSAMAPVVSALVTGAAP